MDWTIVEPLLIPVTILSFAIVARVAGDLSVQAEAKQSSRVARIESAVSRLAASIVSDLLTARSVGTPADALQLLKGEAISKGADYLISVMPDTLRAAGATPASVSGMLRGEVGKQDVLTVAPALLAAAAGAILPSPAPAAVSARSANGPNIAEAARNALTGALLASVLRQGQAKPVVDAPASDVPGAEAAGTTDAPG